MIARPVAWVTRGVLLLAVLMAAGTFAVSAAVPNEAVTAPIVIGDPSIADGPDALDHIRQGIAQGTLGVPTRIDIGNVLGAALALLWIATGGLIVSRQHRNLAGWLLVAVGLGWTAGGPKARLFQPRVGLAQAAAHAVCWGARLDVRGTL